MQQPGACSCRHAPSFAHIAARVGITVIVAMVVGNALLGAGVPPDLEPHDVPLPTFATNAGATAETAPPRTRDVFGEDEDVVDHDVVAQLRREYEKNLFNCAVLHGPDLALKMSTVKVLAAALKVPAKMLAGDASAHLDETALYVGWRTTPRHVLILTYIATTPPEELRRFVRIDVNRGDYFVVVAPEYGVSLDGAVPQCENVHLPLPNVQRRTSVLARLLAAHPLTPADDVSVVALANNATGFGEGTLALAVHTAFKESLHADANTSHIGAAALEGALRDMRRTYPYLACAIVNDTERSVAAYREAARALVLHWHGAPYVASLLSQVQLCHARAHPASHGTTLELDAVMSERVVCDFFSPTT